MPGQPSKRIPESRTEWVIPAGLPAAARGLASVLHSMAKVPRRKSERVIGQGQISVNGSVIRDARHRVETGDRVSAAPGVVFTRMPGTPPREKKSPRPEAEETAARPPISRRMPRPALLYRDQDLAVVFKPAGLLTVPTPKGEKKTLIHWLTRELRESHPRNAIRAVQRLDREVSGILVFALSPAAFEGLRRQFELHLPERKYMALVAGTVHPPQGTFSSLMATNRSLRRYSVESRGYGERAITHYRVVLQTQEVALVEIWLETGRRHQIRVHFSEAGNPVLGDSRYKRHRAAHPAWPEERLALHASYLAFEHPVQSRGMEFHSDLPYEFTRFPGIAVGGESHRGKTPRPSPRASTTSDRKLSSAEPGESKPKRKRAIGKRPPPKR